MEKETVIKALECCGSKHSDIGKYSCKECPLNGQNFDEGACYDEVLHNNALALIKELTEENERLSTALANYARQTEVRIAEEYYTAEAYDELREENEKLKSIGISKDIVIESLAEENETLKDNNEHLAVLLTEAKSDTVREFAEKLKKECLVDSGYEVLQIGTIDRIAKEILNKNTEE